MSTILTQSAAAAFPDRPGTSGMGLLAELLTGEVGSHLVLDLGSAQAVLHVRFTMNSTGLSGGRILLLAGLNSDNLPVIRVIYDTDNGTLTVELPNAICLSKVLNVALIWQCIELSIDTLTGQTRLWVNGVLVDQATGDLSTATIVTLWFGVVQKQTGVTGTLHLDEWCIADEYVGPVIVSPSQSRASDPTCWLVVYNTADQDAAAWAEYYRQLHRLPFANLAGLALPDAETINTTQYENMIDEIEGYISANQLGGQIIGILFGYGVPGYVDFETGMLESVASLMQTGSVSSGTVTNTNASPTTYQRLTIDDLAGVRMTARMDAPDINTATQQIDLAEAITESRLDGNNSAIYFDPFVGTEPSYQAAFTEMLEWALGLRGMRTRLPILLSGNPAGNAEASFTNVTNDGLFWGWSSTLPDPNIFITPAGQRAVCAQMYLEGASATTLRSATPNNWADVPIAAGYASVIVSSRDNPVSCLPNAGAFFDALRQGWTLAEAWHVAQPMLRSGFYLVGDPLMTVAMPFNGFDVFGPLGSLEDLDPSSPSYVLREDVKELDVSANAPEAGKEAIYVIRHVDAEGRSEMGVRSLRIVNVAGESQLPLKMPAWPDIADWPMAIDNGHVRLMARWIEPIRDAKVSSIELLSQAYGQAVVVVEAAQWQPLADHVLIMLPLPDVKTRYRWRLTSQGGDVRYTSFSTWFEPAAVPTLSLQTIGELA